MKKLLSIIVAAVMAVSVFALSVVPAMAAENVSSPTAPVVESKGVVCRVNGAATKTAITYAAAANNANAVVFTYVGEGSLKGWENNMAALGFTAGTDYTAVENADGTYTITFISAAAIESYETGKVAVNALVDFGTGATTAVAGTTNKNDSSKAPATGMASSVVAGSVAVAFAGAAVLAATKKKDAE